MEHTKGQNVVTRPNDGEQIGYAQRVEVLARKLHRFEKKACTEEGLELRGEMLKPWGNIPELTRRVLRNIATQILEIRHDPRPATKGEAPKTKSK